jgi:hypothetical protein
LGSSSWIKSMCFRGSSFTARQFCGAEESNTVDARRYVRHPTQMGCTPLVMPRLGHVSHYGQCLITNREQRFREFPYYWRETFFGVLLATETAVRERPESLPATRRSRRLGVFTAPALAARYVNNRA